MRLDQEGTSRAAGGGASLGRVEGKPLAPLSTIYVSNKISTVERNNP